MNAPRHLLRTSDLDKGEILALIEKANAFKAAKSAPQSLANHIIITIFFENSTRTLSSFEIATKRLGGEVVRLDVSRSSTAKGESMSDTAANLNAMRPSAIIIRHSAAGAGHYLSRAVSCPIINGGDGAHSHPTQALLDLMTIKNHFDARKKPQDSKNSQDSQNSLEGRRVAIVGDIKNSRVANSNIELLRRFGMEVVLVAPPHFLPLYMLESSGDCRSLDGIEVADNIAEVAKKVDVIMSLRTQTERHEEQIYGSLRDYAAKFCITQSVLGDNDVILLHPGPVHRNIDISDAALRDPRSKVLEQVENGVCLRMAVLDYFINL